MLTFLKDATKPSLQRRLLVGESAPELRTRSQDMKKRINEMERTFKRSSAKWKGCNGIKFSSRVATVLYFRCRDGVAGGEEDLYVDH